jgi:DtxR family Mn-dependent transcriptional regulator
MPSENVENYLKRIYTIELSGERVSTSLLSEKLQISSASVSEMIKRLADQGNVNYTPYHGVELTTQGRKRAIGIIRRHRLWELFLVNVLNYRWDEVHEEAERLEHVTSAAMERKLDEFLGRPTFDPHGDAIPTADGMVVDGDSVQLSLVGPSCVVVRRVSDEKTEVLQHASRLGITLNKEFRVKEKIPFDDSMLVEIDGKEQFVSGRMAENIFVEIVQQKKGKHNGRSA